MATVFYEVFFRDIPPAASQWTGGSVQGFLEKRQRELIGLFNEQYSDYVFHHQTFDLKVHDEWKVRKTDVGIRSSFLNMLNPQEGGLRAEFRKTLGADQSMFMEEQKDDDRSTPPVPHLYGETSFGNGMDVNSMDEWAIASFLCRITAGASDICARVYDDSGMFLLIEACDYVPEWMQETPTVASHRVWVCGGRVHMVPKEVCGGHAAESFAEMKKSVASSSLYVSPIRGLCAVWSPKVDTSDWNAANNVNRYLSSRLLKPAEQYCKENGHSRRCILSAPVAAVLTSNRHLIPRICQAYAFRTPAETRRAQKLRIVSGAACEEWSKVCKCEGEKKDENYVPYVCTSVTFSKLHYAQLMQKQLKMDGKFIADVNNCAVFECKDCESPCLGGDAKGSNREVCPGRPRGEPEWPPLSTSKYWSAWDVGYRLSIGLEILIEGAVKQYKKAQRKLKKKPYEAATPVRGFAKDFCGTHGCNPDKVASIRNICAILGSWQKQSILLGDQLRSRWFVRFAELDDDSEQWMHVKSMHELDKYLESFASVPEDKEEKQSTLLKDVDSFLNATSSYEGVETQSAKGDDVWDLPIPQNAQRHTSIRVMPDVLDMNQGEMSEWLREQTIQRRLKRSKGKGNVAQPHLVDVDSDDDELLSDESAMDSDDEIEHEERMNPGLSDERVLNVSRTEQAKYLRNIQQSARKFMKDRGTPNVIFEDVNVKSQPSKQLEVIESSDDDSDVITFFDSCATTPKSRAERNGGNERKVQKAKNASPSATRSLAASRTSLYRSSPKSKGAQPSQKRVVENNPSLSDFSEAMGKELSSHGIGEEFYRNQDAKRALEDVAELEAQLNGQVRAPEEPKAFPTESSEQQQETNLGLNLMTQLIKSRMVASHAGISGDPSTAILTGARKSSRLFEQFAAESDSDDGVYF